MQKIWSVDSEENY